MREMTRGEWDVEEEDEEANGKLLMDEEEGERWGERETL